MNRVKETLRGLVQPLLAVVIGLLAGAVAILVVGGNVFETYAEMWKGAFGNFYFFTNTLARSTPIILAGLGVALAFRAGFFNMGAEGQMILGGSVQRSQRSICQARAGLSVLRPLWQESWPEESGPYLPAGWMLGLA